MTSGTAPSCNDLSDETFSHDLAQLHSIHLSLLFSVVTWRSKRVGKTEDIRVLE